ncbi:hypothetical protein ACFL2U_00275 [Patescibacteria group bacterium]
MKKTARLMRKIVKFLHKNQFVLYLLIFFIAFYVFLWLQATPTFLDPDSFYHLKVSQLISQQGPVLDFPWLQFTVLKDYYIDHHFLYHVAAVPFINLLGDFIGFKVFTVVLSTAFILLAYWFFKKEKIKFAEAFALILLFAPAFLFRLSLSKATAFSLIILFIGIFCLFRKKYWLLILISFLYVWSYGGFLLILVMSAFYVLANAIYLTFINFGLWQRIKRKFVKLKLKDYLIGFLKNLFSINNLILLECSFIGVLAGLILNPYFPKNLKFYWQQIFEIGIVNYQSAVNVGGEWHPYPILDLISDSGVAIIFIIVSVVLFFIFIKKQKPTSIFFFIASIFFFILTLKSKRYVEYFVPFAVFFSAYAFTYSVAKVKIRHSLWHLKKQSYFIGSMMQFLLIYVAIIFPFIMLKDSYLVRQQYQGGFEFDKFAGIANYLQINTQPGDVVMHTDWDDFPMLFYHNHSNYYIVGLDPTFMYNYDADLYNLYADITTARKTRNLYKAIKENFRARYFIVNEDRQQLAKNLQRAGGFTKVYQDKDGTIYKIK